MKLKIGDRIRIVHDQFKLTNYFISDNAFECSSDITDNKLQNAWQKGPSMIRNYRFSLPGTFCNLNVEPILEYYIPEVDKYPYNGRLYDNDNYIVRVQDSEEGWKKVPRKYKIVEPKNFDTHGIYYLEPVFDGSTITKRAKERFAPNSGQPGYNLVGNLWDGADINGILLRIFHCKLGYTETDRAAGPKLERVDIQYTEEADYRDYPVRKIYGVMGTDDFDQHLFPLRHLSLL